LAVPLSNWCILWRSIKFSEVDFNFQVLLLLVAHWTLLPGRLPRSGYQNLLVTNYRPSVALTTKWWSGVLLVHHLAAIALSTLAGHEPHGEARVVVLGLSAGHTTAAHVGGGASELAGRHDHLGLVIVE
jgi:hypothetical protein